MLRAKSTGLMLATMTMAIPVQASALPIEAMPEENTAFMTAMSRLAASHDPGRRPLLFSIVSGATAVEPAQ